MNQATIGWLIFALLCALIEIPTPIFGFILISAAALLASAFAAADFPLWVQIAAFVVGAFLALTVLRTRIMEKLGPTPGVPSRTDKLIGHHARVTEAIDPALGLGRVIVDGHDWAAAAGQPLQVGEDVIVEGTDGIKLKVRKP